MSKKFIKTAVAALALATGVGTVGTITADTAQPVQAASKSYILNHTTKFKKARILKKTYVRKIHLRTPRYKSTLGPKYYLSKNQIVYVKRLGTDFGWYVKVPGYSGQWTVSGRKLSDTSWFSFNTKVIKKRKPGFTKNSFTGKDGGTIVFDNLKSHKVKDHTGIFDNKTVFALTLEATFINNTKKSISPDDWMLSNLSVESDGYGWDKDIDGHDLLPVSIMQYIKTGYSAKIKKLEKKIKPGQSVEFVAPYDLQPNPKPTYIKLTAMDNDATKTLKIKSGKSYK